MWAHWRLGLGAIIGVAAWIGAVLLGAPIPMRSLIGWDVGALVYLAFTWKVFLTDTEEEVRGRCEAQDERRGVILALVLLAILAALGAIVAALIAVRGPAKSETLPVAALAGITLIISWVVLQSIFAAHYAHRHFQAVSQSGPPAGFLFPGEAPRTYMDFVYLAVCIGATAQISDPCVPTTPLRNLVTAHAAVSFFYNTAVLALGINILSSLVGH
jgi:uncharacterized membrane protein